MELPGRCGDWFAPPPSPPRATTPDRHDEQGMGTSHWPPTGTSTWPPPRTFSRPRTYASSAPLSWHRQVSGQLVDGCSCAARWAVGCKDNRDDPSLCACDSAMRGRRHRVRRKGRARSLSRASWVGRFDLNAIMRRGCSRWVQPGHCRFLRYCGDCHAVTSTQPAVAARDQSGKAAIEGRR
jgi:hypothetical protein